MIRSSVRKRLRNVYYRTPPSIPNPPVILYANHHGWMDGYLMYLLVNKLELVSLDWIQEYDAFPLFRYVGGLRFAAGDVMDRAHTVRKTIRAMRKEAKSLVLFPEGVLHRPPDLLPFGRAMQTVATKVPGVTLLPIAIRYEYALHERPEAWISVGAPHRWDSLEECQERIGDLLLERDLTFDVLFSGTPDINERMDMRNMGDRGRVR